jgi:hypothetical protein
MDGWDLSGMQTVEENTTVLQKVLATFNVLQVEDPLFARTLSSHLASLSR